MNFIFKRIISILKVSFLLVSGVFFSANLNAKQKLDLNEKLIASLASDFVKIGCNKKFFKNQKEKYNFLDKWSYLYDESDVNRKISELKKDEACLITRMNNFEMFDGKNNKTKNYNNVSYIVFKSSINTSRMCARGSEVTSPFIIEYRVENNVLVRNILKNENSDFKCFLTNR